MRPKISAYCLTYRKPEVLEEAIFSFLQQDYSGEKELVIINDEPKQTLVYNHPQIRIINMTSRAPDIVTKYNEAVSRCAGDICVPWDDDDVCLPHRLTTIASNMVSGLWYSNLMFTDAVEGELQLTSGEIHNNHAFTKDNFIRIGAYHDEPKFGYDFRFMSALRNTLKLSGKVITNKNMPSYIYRKHSIKTPNHSNHIAQDKENHYKNYSDALDGFQEGVIVLCPKWSRDWTGMCLTEWNAKPTPKKLHEVDSVFPHADKKDLEEK